MNVLYIDIGNLLSESHLYPYYGGVYREICNLSNVYTHQGYISDIDKFLGNMEQQVDCIIFGLGYFAQGSPSFYSKISGLAELKIPVVCMLHKPQSLLREKLDFCKINKVDLLVDSQTTHEEFGKIAETPSIQVPFTANPHMFKPRRDIEKVYDLGFSGALHGSGKVKGETMDLRTRVRELIDLKKYPRVFWNGSDSVSTRIPTVEEYAKKINECKIWISTTGPMLDVGPRYYEVIMSKTLLFCNDMPESNGEFFVDGVTCVTFKNDLSDFDDKLMYYLENDEERNVIIENAYRVGVNNYTWNHMAQKILTEVRKIRDEQD